MKKITALIFLFFLAVSIPLGYLVIRSYTSLKQEEIDKLRYFANTLFEGIEEELAFVVMREERRAIDEYNNSMVKMVNHQAASGKNPVSAQSKFPQEPYILAYLQNNPDGSFQTPVTGTDKISDSKQADFLVMLKKINDQLNSRWSTVATEADNRHLHIIVKDEKIDTSGYARKYLKLSRFRKQKYKLRHNKSRTEYLTYNQLVNIAKLDKKIENERSIQSKNKLNVFINDRLKFKIPGGRYTYASIYQNREVLNNDPVDPSSEVVMVQVDPVRSIFIDDQYVFVFRRILLNNQSYRQGVVVNIQDFLDHFKAFFVDQPMATFANLRLVVSDKERKIATVSSGAAVKHRYLVMNHIFSAPFSFLHAEITSENIPPSPARRPLDIMVIALVSVLFMGLISIYKSTRTVVDLSERRSGFVASVTHELKTPLTTIRMYIEMLEQGMARSHEQEQGYYRIVTSECSRLSRLINNVLEFSKLEKKKRHFDIKEGQFEDVISEVKDIMKEKLQQEGFSLLTDITPCSFKYDREAMIQVLINLIENSVKFGTSCSIKQITICVKPEGRNVNISVSDTGPGIPRHALKKIFDNFYRVDNDLCRKTGGTGIGLALVKNFIISMGGSINASNNKDAGCSINILMPLLEKG